MKRRFGKILALVVLAMGTQAFAEGVTPETDFTFRRISVPTQGSTTRRITVQIDPVEQARRRDALQAVAEAKRAAAEAEAAEADSGEGTADGPRAPTSGGTDWYWAGVSPALGYVGPDRLAEAVNFLSDAPEGETVYAPRLQTLQNMANAHGRDILLATIGKEVSPALVLAVIAVESAGRTDAVSSAGATGLMQLMPATAERFGVSDSSVATENIKGGVAYLDWLMKEFEGDPIMVLAGYNAGENAVKSHGGVPPYAETRAYVPKVLAAWSVARGLCLTPPELASDGCVFAGQQVAADG